MARGFRRKKGGYVAGLDAQERAVLVSLMSEVLAIIEPPEPVVAPGADPFDEMLRRAGLAHLDVGPVDAAADAVVDPADDPARDPALDRLLPDAHHDDPLVSAEFRRMVGPGLRARKAANLADAIEALRAAEADRVRLDPSGARGFAMALTDVRLVLGERMGLRTDHDMDLLERAAAAEDAEPELAWAVAVYDFLTWLQESLTQALLADL